MPEPKPETYFQVGDPHYPRENDPMFTTEAEACKHAIDALDDMILAGWRLWNFGGNAETTALIWEGTEWRP